MKSTTSTSTARPDEIVFVIEGVLSDEYGDLTAGNVAYRLIRTGRGRAQAGG
jgi:hypothetical protein